MDTMTATRVPWSETRVNVISSNLVTITFRIPNFTSLKTRTSPITSAHAKVGHFGLRFEVIPKAKDCSNLYVAVQLASQISKSIAARNEPLADITQFDQENFRKVILDAGRRGQIDERFDELRFPLFRPADRGVAFAAEDFWHRDIWGSEPSTPLRLNTLMVRAEIKLLNLVGQTAPSLPIPEPQVSPAEERFREIFQSTVGRDFVLVSTEGSEHAGHKNVLSAASPVFKEMFGNADSRENRKGRCVLKKVSSAALEVLMRFMYYGSLEGLADNEMELLVAAEEYELPDLKKACENALVKGGINAENMEELLFVADKAAADELKQAVLKYIEKNRNAAHMSETIHGIMDSAMKRRQGDLVKELFALAWPRPSSSSSDVLSLDLDSE